MRKIATEITPPNVLWASITQWRREIMNTLSKLSLASALMLSVAFGVASAQQANDAPPPPGGACAGPDVGPNCDAMQQADRGDRGERMRHGRGGHKGHGGKGMRMIDANNDGVIGADEASALADREYMRLDKDRDGKVTEAEFVVGPRGKRAWFNWSSDEAAAVEKVRKDKFAALDANKDTGLDKTEFFADAKAKLAAADTDKDGKVTPWEFRASR
jgi:EF hand